MAKAYKNNNHWERVSDCVDPKHGNGFVCAPEWGVSKYTFKYEFEDGYCEYIRFISGKEGRPPKLVKGKYGFLKAFRGKFESLPDGPLQIVPKDKYDRTVTEHSIKYDKKEAKV